MDAEIARLRALLAQAHAVLAHGPEHRMLRERIAAALSAQPDNEEPG